MTDEHFSRIPFYYALGRATSGEEYYSHVIKPKKKELKKMRFCEFMIKLSGNKCPIPCESPCVKDADSWQEEIISLAIERRREERILHDFL